MPGGKFKPWTGAERVRLKTMWTRGITVPRIAELLGRSEASIANAVHRDRASFPRRHSPKSTGHGERYQIWLSRLVRVRLDARAKNSGVSAAMLLRGIVRVALMDDSFMDRVEELVRKEASRN